MWQHKDQNLKLAMLGWLVLWQLTIQMTLYVDTAKWSCGYWLSEVYSHQNAGRLVMYKFRVVCKRFCLLSTQNLLMTLLYSFIHESPVHPEKCLWLFDNSLPKSLRGISLVLMGCTLSIHLQAPMSYTSAYPYLAATWPATLPAQSGCYTVAPHTCISLSQLRNGLDNWRHCAWELQGGFIYQCVRVCVCAPVTMEHYYGKPRVDASQVLRIICRLFWWIHY